MGTILTVATSKGGGGKTATVMLLAANLAQHGAKVCVIDADKNGTFSHWHSGAYEGPPIVCMTETRHVELVDLAQKFADEVDVLFIDTPGFENLASSFAIGTSDHVLIPCMSDRGSVVEAIKTAKTAASFGGKGRRAIPASVVLTRWNAAGQAEAAALAELHTAGLDVLAPPLPPRVAFQKTTWSGAVPVRGAAARPAELLLRSLSARGAIPKGLLK